jgi:DMSO/TMAO reductase YedYZ molybdopterin-dependent catalytic subunit
VYNAGNFKWSSRLYSRQPIDEFNVHKHTNTEGLHGIEPTDQHCRRLVVDGMIAHPASFSVAELKSFPTRTQITMIGCEEGWTYIAEWTGVPLSHILGTGGDAAPGPIRCVPLDPTRGMG